MSGLDLDRLAAIDAHAHVEAAGHGPQAAAGELRAAASKYFKGDPYHPTVPQIAADYHSQNMAAVIFTVDAAAATGEPAADNEERAPVASRAPAHAAAARPPRSTAETAAAAAEHPDILIPFGSIAPARGAAGV